MPLSSLFLSQSPYLYLSEKLLCSNYSVWGYRSSFLCRDCIGCRGFRISPDICFFPNGSDDGDEDDAFGGA